MNQERGGESETVVFVHGLWMKGFELFLLRRRIESAGYQSHRFSYRTMAATLDENAAALQSCVSRLQAETVHLVAHSLGGVLTIRLFERYGACVNGRIVFLGSPVRGSSVARSTAERPFGEAMLGRSGQEGLLGETEPKWTWPNPLGILAGTRSIGVGRVVSDMDGPGDGTVALAETEIDGAADSIAIPVTHMSMLFSRRVSDRVVHFLRNGSFE
jgi:pimeloyl-ACP methyl ester carboxylesterase